MRVLVTGGAGQVGREVAAAFAGHDVLAPGHGDLDVTDRDAVLQAITTFVPDAVVHCAAWTAVDACEGDPDRAFAANALGTRHVMDGVRRVGAHLVAISTDYVFSGDQERPYVEWDRPDPRSAYGRSKLAGEAEVDPGHAIVRTSWVCGRYGANMVKTILRLAGEHDTLRFVDDQRGRPTFADDLAVVLRHLAVGRIPGVFHAANQGETTWFAFARDVLAASGADPERVQPIRTADLDPPRPAPRPANSVLDDAALRLTGLPRLPDHRESLARLVAELTET